MVRVVRKAPHMEKYADDTTLKIATKAK